MLTTTQLSSLLLCWMSNVDGLHGSDTAYDIDEVILHHTVPQRQTVNAAYYCIFLRNHLCPALRRKRQHLLATYPIILHDNARTYTANIVTDLLRCWRWEILGQPPYSPDMSPCDYDLFAKMKEPL